MNRAKVRENWAKIRSVACPECGAPPHCLCVTPGGKPASPPHQARRRAAADKGVYVPGGAR